MSWRRLIDDQREPTLIIDVDITDGALKKAFAGVEHGYDIWAWQELVEETRGVWQLAGDPIWTHGVGAPGSMLCAGSRAPVKAERSRRPLIDRELDRAGDLIAYLATHEDAVADVTTTQPIAAILQDRAFAPRTRAGGTPHPGDVEAVNTAAQRRYRQRKREGRGPLPRLTLEEQRLYRLSEPPDDRAREAIRAGKIRYLPEVVAEDERPKRDRR